MAISDDLFRAILAMDAYNRGYNLGIAGLGGLNTGIGLATVKQDSRILDTEGNAGVDQAASFFAQAYTWNGKTVIAYRGTETASMKRSHSG
jgi:hypothetical protein